MKVRKLKEKTVRRKISVVEKTILSSAAGCKGNVLTVKESGMGTGCSEGLYSLCPWRVSRPD